MGIEDLQDDHKRASSTRDMLAEKDRDETASQFESRYIECLNQGASKIEARQIALGEVVVDRGEEVAERIGNGFSAVDGMRHENEQWREQAGVSPPDDS